MKKAIWLIVTLLSIQSCLSESEKGEIFLTEASPSKGFNYPYFLYIPEGASLKKELVLIVEPNNSGFADDDLNKHIEKAKRTATLDYYPGNYAAQKLKYPLLVPVFPRSESEWKIYTHALDRDVMLQKDNPLERIDLQLLAMVEDAKSKLAESGYTIQDKFFITGFSASGTFTNRFTLIHPEKIQASATGGLNGLLALPIDSFGVKNLNYPLGINDFKDLLNQEFQRTAFLNTPQFYFMGENDENDAIPYDDAFDQDERELIYEFLGEEMLTKRWKTCADIYKNKGVNASIKTYTNTGHEHPESVKQEIVEFFKKSLNTDHEIMVNVPESQLYVRIRGNAGKPLIINLHGGPGGYSGIDIKLMGPGLEDKFLIAYLDQRGCGKSLECKNNDLLTVEQYVEDLDIVIDSLRKKYDKEKVHIMGTSWGGMYGFLYLLTDQTKVLSYACIDGKVNSNYQNHSLIDFETNRANEILQTDIPEEQKAELEHIVTELERIKNSNFAQFHTDVNWMKHEVPEKLGFNAYFADTSKIISFKDVVQDTALMRLMKYSKEEYAEVGEKAEIVNTAFRNTLSYNNINIESELKQIKIPTIVIQGKQDYVVGTGHAELIYNALTNLSKDKKELHIIPDVGHCPAIESPQLLSDILVVFFEKESLKN